MRRILVPLDGSRLAETAVAAVHKLFGTQVYALTLLRVVPQTLAEGAAHPVWGPVGEWIDVLPSIEERVAEAQAYLNAVRDRWSGMAHVRTEVRVGAPAPLIRDVAQEAAVDMIAMASHGRTGLARAMLGSVTDLVLRSVSIPVLVVQPQERDFPTTGDERDSRQNRQVHPRCGPESYRRMHTVVPFNSRERAAP